jgi:hypothetical protein
LIRWFLEHPLTRGLDEDDPNTTRLRRRVIYKKAFLKKIYKEWYGFVLSALPAVKGYILEIGTGAGFFKEIIPKEIADITLSTEVLFIDKMDVILRAEKLPFKKNALRSIVLIDVFHHIPTVRRFS